MAWRAYIGQWECDDWDRWQDGQPGDWAHLDAVFDGYVDARRALAGHLAPFLVDTCEDCQRQVTAELTRLMSLDRGEEFQGEVEGEEYLLIRQAK